MWEPRKTSFFWALKHGASEPNLFHIPWLPKSPEMGIPSALAKDCRRKIPPKRHCASELLRHVETLAVSMAIIDQINKSLVFHRDSDSEQFSCGLLFKPRACLLDNFPGNRPRSSFSFLYWIKVGEKKRDFGRWESRKAGKRWSLRITKTTWIESSRWWSRKKCSGQRSEVNVLIEFWGRSETCY